MRISAARLQNYKQYSDFIIHFPELFNVIVGINGIGKTSVLSGVAEALNGLWMSSKLHAAPSLVGEQVPRLDRFDLRGTSRFEPAFPVIVTFKGELDTGSAEWSISREGGQSSGRVFDEGWGIAGILRSLLHDSPFGAPLPMVAFYRADRRWAQKAADGLKAATKRDSRADGYLSWEDASRDADNLQLWIIAKCLERLQSIAEPTPGVRIQDDELGILTSVVSVVLGEDIGFHYQLRSKTLLVQWHSRAPTPFENLSDGQRAVLCLVADIVRRMCLLNPQFGGAVAERTSGIILIDELDLHLHPAWQRMLVIGLKKAFPAIQFIVASHSPQIISELQPSEVLLLSGQRAEHPQVSYGLDASRVLEEIMEAPSRPETVQILLSQLFKLLDEGRLDDARQLIDALRSIAPGVADIARAEALLKRKEIIGR